MALTGLVLIGFVFVHMAGNLQVLAGQAQINAYAHSLTKFALVYFMGFPAIFIGCSFNSCVDRIFIDRGKPKGTP